MNSDGNFKTGVVENVWMNQRWRWVLLLRQQRQWRRWRWAVAGTRRPASAARDRSGNRRAGDPQLAAWDSRRRRMSNEAGQTMRIIINLSVYFSSKATEEDTLFVCFCFVCFVSELETNQANKLIIAWPGFISQHESDEMIEAKKHRVRGEGRRRRRKWFQKKKTQKKIIIIIIIIKPNQIKHTQRKYRKIIIIQESMDTAGACRLQTQHLRDERRRERRKMSASMRDK